MPRRSKSTKKPSNNRLIACKYVDERADASQTHTVSTVDQHFHSHASFDDLPAEIIDRVCFFSDTKLTLTSLLLVNRIISSAAAYHRYSKLLITSSHTISCLGMLASGRPVALKYCRLVKSLSYEISDRSHRYPAAKLLSLALLNMLNLISLSISLRSDDVDFFMLQASRDQVVRRSEESILCLIAGANTSCVRALPSLRRLVIDAPISVLALAHHRTLYELDLTLLMNYQDVAELTKSSAMLCGPLEVLHVRFLAAVDLPSTLLVMSQAFPHLSTLVVHQASMNTNVSLSSFPFISTSESYQQDVLDGFCQYRNQYPKLSRLALNPFYETLFPQELMWRALAEARYCLIQVGIGRRLWRASYCETFLEEHEDSEKMWWFTHVMANRPQTACLPVFTLP
jgi:hypothetical protein